jgi:alpha-galactosidase
MMTTSCRLLPILAVALLVPCPAWAARPTADEMNQSRQWAHSRFEGRSDAEPFFSFRYANKPSKEWLATWPCQRSSRTLDESRVEFTSVYSDPATKLVVRLVGIEYRDFPAVEWTLYLSNTGTQPTPLVEDVQAIDLRLTRSADAEFVLHGIKGDFCTADSYEPYRLELGPNVAKKFAPPAHSGKSCDGPDGWPYYNLQTPEGGLILAIGWPGQWASSFVRDAGRTLSIRAGQQNTHLVLKPGEEIRTPLVALLFWQGTDRVRSQNLWRRWYLAHTLPRIDGHPQPPVLQIQTAATEANIAFVKSVLQAGIRPDVCWRDASWYPLDTGPHKGKNAWLNTGTWEPDPARFPHGFRPFSDWVHAHGMQFLLWFEPERVGDPNSWLAKQHPEWLLPGAKSTGDLLDEGNPKALAWLIDHVDGMIRREGLDWYREDMNGGGPLPAWRKHDADDRQGITENFYVQGHLKFWDELRRRHPHLRIDSCASGGRRNDLETMRRAVPLLRSDFQWPEMPGVVEGNQAHTYSLSSWLPFQGTGAYVHDLYSYRSFYLPSFGTGRLLTPQYLAVQQQAYQECRRVAPAMLFGDYYPLTDYSRRLDQWIAWQFDRPERGEGIVQAFRRGECREATVRYRLRGLEPDAVYVLTNFDAPAPTELTGRELTDVGLPITISSQPGAAIIAYEKKR